jgi:uncharacterized damage-inducible protein DinB
MEMIEHFRRQFAYDTWANREVLAAVRASREKPERSLQMIGHVLSAGQLWMARLKQQPQGLPVWPELTLEECEAQTTELGRQWQEYLATLPATGLSQTAAYKNSKGEPWSSTVEDILTHVLMHGAYHRGQIASHMRTHGQTPAYTDFIHAIRQGLIE